MDGELRGSGNVLLMIIVKRKEKKEASKRKTCKSGIKAGSDHS
jgi:hypothetical protein